MDEARRRVAAYVAGTLISGQHNVSGTSIDGGVKLYDFATSQYADLRIDGTRFNGYDWSTSTYFDGAVMYTGITFTDPQGGPVYRFDLRCRRWT